MSGVQCPENERLLNLFGEAVSELLMFQEQHFVALLKGDPGADRFELLIHVAAEKRQAAKNAYVSHIEEHGCEITAQNALIELGSMRARRNAERPERRMHRNPSRNLRRRLSDLDQNG